MAEARDLPYRPCAGMMLLGPEGRVFIGRRTEGPEMVDAAHAWQMPQGGIDDGEEPYPAALRELYEETSIRSVERLGETGWISYDLPPDLVGVAWKGKYRGQRQKWFLLRFTGAESEIDVTHPGGGAHRAEFAEWRWERADRVADLVVPFKRAVNERVIAEFMPLIARVGWSGDAR
jgi:putative (di)nucleoside polyphosphate hydrolase